MLIKGNSKLGKEIYHFSLPAGKTCPGQTEACASVCYAKAGFYYFDNVKASLRKSLVCSKRADFAEKMIEAIGRRTISTLRIHAAGDFYSAIYIRKWIKIAKACPRVTFYAYTRSWRRKQLLKALAEFAALDNVALWFSADKDTDTIDGAPPAVDRVRVAYMQMDDLDPVPAYPKLVFRVKDDSVMTRINGIAVCPVENGIKRVEDKKPTCSKCKLCYRTTVQLDCNKKSTLVPQERAHPGICGEYAATAAV